MYWTQHVLIRLLEERRKQLDHNKIVGTVHLDLSKAFETLNLVFSYLKNRKQSVNIKTNYTSFLELLSGVAQASVLGTVLCNIFLNDLFFFIKKTSLHNYADDNTLSAFAADIDDLTEILTDESQKTIDWLKLNQMILRVSSHLYF